MNNMSYIWQDFNIKTFRAETVVFRDGVFCPEFSTLDGPVIDKKYDLPVHFIYVGEISGDNNLDIVINENVKNQKIYLSGKIKVVNNARLNISIKNSGIDSDLRGFFIVENHGVFNCNLDAYHLCRKTGIFIKTRVLGYKNSESNLNGTAHIYKYCENCESDITFAALATPDAKITFLPAQRISSVPKRADHGASIYSPKPIQVQYLRAAGLGTIEVNDVMRAAFMNDFSLF